MNFWTAIAASSIVLALGFLLAWLATSRLKIESGGAVASLVFLPIISYLVFSGQIAEIKGLGIEAKLRDVASDSVAGAVSTRQLDTRDVLGSDAAEEDLERAAFFTECVDVIVINADEWSQIDNDTLLRRATIVGHTIYNSILSGCFEGLVIVGSDQKPIGVFERTLFLDLLRISFEMYAVSAPYQDLVMTRDEILARLQRTELWIILKNPRRRAELSGNKAWVPDQATRLAALKEMHEQSYEIMAVVSAVGSYAGLVSRHRLLTGLVVSFLSE